MRCARSVGGKAGVPGRAADALLSSDAAALATPRARATLSGRLPCATGRPPSLPKPLRLTPRPTRRLVSSPTRSDCRRDPGLPRPSPPLAAWRRRPCLKGLGVERIFRRVSLQRKHAVAIQECGPVPRDSAAWAAFWDSETVPRLMYFQRSFAVRRLLSLANVCFRLNSQTSRGHGRPRSSAVASSLSPRVAKHPAFG